MNYIIISITIFFNINVYGQNQYSLSGTISEKIKFTKSGTVLEILESYDPPKPFKLEMEPGILIFSFDGKTTEYYSTRPAYKDSNQSMIFLVSMIKGSMTPEVLFMITPENDKLWMFLNNENQTAEGFYLR